MENFDGLLLQLLEEEKSLQFTEFSNQTALQIGLILVDLAKARGLSVAIDITNGHQLFYCNFLPALHPIMTAGSKAKPRSLIW